MIERIDEKIEESKHEIQIVANMLNVASKPLFDDEGTEVGSVDLTTEFVWSALTYAKTHPNETIFEICSKAISVWADKND